MIARTIAAWAPKLGTALLILPLLIACGDDQDGETGFHASGDGNVSNSVSNGTTGGNSGASASNGTTGGTTGTSNGTTATNNGTTSTSNGTTGTSNGTTGTSNGTTGPILTEVTFTADTTTATVGEAPITITVAARLSDGSPANTTLRVIEQAVADPDNPSDALGFFGDPPPSGENRGFVDLPVNEGEAQTTFRCETPGATTLIAQETDGATLAGELTLTCLAPMVEPPELRVTVRRGGEVLENPDILADNIDEVTIAVQAVAPPNAGYSVEGLELEFFKLDDLGYLKEDADDTTRRSTLTRALDAEGSTEVIFAGGGIGGDSQLEIALPDPRPGAPEGAMIVQVLAIHITALQAIEVSNVTGFTMGTRYTDAPDAITVTFLAKDNRMVPMPGVTVELELTAPRDGVVVEPTTGITNEDGELEVTVTSGYAQASAMLAATGYFGDISVFITSPPFPMLADRPNRDGMELVCDAANVGALVAPLEGDAAGDGFVCTTLVLDRHGNPLGIPTPVRMLIEAGTVTESQDTFPWDTSVHSVRPPVETGFATARYIPDGALPCPVAPIEGEPADAEDGECSGEADDRCPAWEGCADNPRDGVVTVVAVVDGEEAFNDANANRRYDEGEPFWDQGEPYVDANDNGAYDTGELFMDTDDSGAWDGPNGVWDSDAALWTATRVVWSGDPMAPTFFDTASPEVVIEDGHALVGAIDAVWHDGNLNPPGAEATYAVDFVGEVQGLTVTLEDGEPLDDAGFTISEESVVMMGVGSYVPQIEGWSSRPGRTVRATVAIEDSEAFTQDPVVEFVVRYPAPGQGEVREVRRSLRLDLSGW